MFCVCVCVCAEELMLLANRSVATVIAEHYPDRALLRRHPPPQDKGLGACVCVCVLVCGCEWVRVCVGGGG